MYLLLTDPNDQEQFLINMNGIDCIMPYKDGGCTMIWNDGGKFRVAESLEYIKKKLGAQ